MIRTESVTRAVAVAVVAVVAAVVAAAAPAARANQLVEITIPDRSHEIPNQWLPKYPKGGPPKAMVILPTGYDPARAYPLLVLLPGLDNTYKSWTDRSQGDAATILKDLDAIVVTPEGADGWYTDWWNGGKRADPAWESYQLDEVLPQILERYKIRPERGYHALAGASMGGLGAAYLGSRLPGFFGSVAIISGLVDFQAVPGSGTAPSLLSYANAGMAPTDPEAVFGPPGGFYETGHNPPDLAANMAQTRMFMTTGDGTPAPDSTSATGGDNAKEGAIIRPTSDNYAAALRAAGVELVYHVHAGYHDWPNFHNELREMVAWGLFKPVDKHATSWVNDTVATHGKLWEFAYRFDAPPDRVVRFQRRGDILLVGAAGTPVTITTDGGCVIHANTPAEVDVPPAPCQRLSLTVSPTRLRAGRRGVVRVTVTPAIAGAVVRNGSQSAATDDHGTARLRLCVNPRSRLRITATATNYLPATALVRARGTPRRCGRS